MGRDLERKQVVPLTRGPLLSDRLARHAGLIIPMKCPVCGRISVAVAFRDNLRESGTCLACRATNRQRQLAWVLLQLLLPGPQKKNGLSAVSSLGTRIFSAEAKGPIHRALTGSEGYVCSEYVGPACEPGENIAGTRHEDLQALSFAPGSLDVVLTADVLEHVPDPYQAHQEIFRVLRPDGAHVFTVPFLDRELDQVRSCRTADGAVTHMMEPQYHTDPLREGGALVYTLFGLEMLVRLAEIGFRTKLYNVRAPRYGIYGENAFVFVARKSGCHDMTGGH